MLLTPDAIGYCKAKNSISALAPSQNPLGCLQRFPEPLADLGERKMDDED